MTLPSGLQYKVLRASTVADGKTPKPDSPCKCHYEGKLIDGTVFDSSFKRGQPSTFAPNQVIKGWTEVMQLMKEVRCGVNECAGGKYSREGGAWTPLPAGRWEKGGGVRRVVCAVLSVGVYVWRRVCVRPCVRACTCVLMRACVCLCVRVCVRDVDVYSVC